MAVEPYELEGQEMYIRGKSEPRRCPPKRKCRAGQMPGPERGPLVTSLKIWVSTQYSITFMMYYDANLLEDCPLY